MRVGLIGAGPRAEILARSIPPWVEIVGVASLSGKSSDSLSKILNVPKMSVQELLRPTDIKSVIIATPVDSLDDVLSESIGHKKHVFIEKPGSTTSARCQEMMKQSWTTGRVVRVGFSWVDDFTSSSGDEWRSIDIDWVKKTTGSDDLIRNLASHPVSLLVSWGLLESDLLKWTTSPGLVEGSVNCQGRCVKITILVDSQKEDSLKVQVDDRIIPRRIQRDSAYRQLRNFFEDVRSQRIKGPRDLSFALSVLKVLGV